MSLPQGVQIQGKQTYSQHRNRADRIPVYQPKSKVGNLGCHAHFSVTQYRPCLSTGWHKSILTNEALQFLATLHRNFEPTRKTVRSCKNIRFDDRADPDTPYHLQLLQRRQLYQAQLDAGALPDFLPETKNIRDDATWTAAPPGPSLRY